jgi:pSer/pThr/pTyr-binding forkhead associated (FHA) protein
MILKLVDDQGRIQDVRLDSEDLTIGRDPSNRLHLPERNVSRFHARLFRESGAWYVEEARCRYGLYVNGEKLAGRVRVKPGDTLKIGDFAMAFELEEGEVSTSHSTTPLLEVVTPADGLMAEPEELPPELPAPAMVKQQEESVPRPRTRSDGSEITAMLSAEDVAREIAKAKEEMTQKAAQQGPARTATMEAVAPAEGAGQALPLPPTSRIKLAGESEGVTGLEFVLDKSVVLVGRAAECDIVIDHRSVSGEHARVVFENGHFIVYDLGSTNGVRVNSEPYASCVLQHNDQVQFGHVRFRVLRPGESLKREGQAVEAPVEPRGTGALKWAAVVLAILAALAVVMLYVVRFAGSPGPQEAAAPEQPTVTQPAPAPGEPQEDPEAEYRARFEKAKGLMAKGSWAEARALLQDVHDHTQDKLLQTNALNSLDIVGLEEPAQKLAEDVDALKNGGKVAEAWLALSDGLEQVSPTTRAAPRLAELKAALQPLAAAALLQVGKAALEARDVEKARDALAHVVKLDAANPGAKKLEEDLAAFEKRQAAEKAAEGAGAGAKKAAPVEDDVAPVQPLEAMQKQPSAPTVEAPREVAKANPTPPAPAGPDTSAMSGLDVYKLALKAKASSNIAEAKRLMAVSTGKGYAVGHKALAEILRMESNYKEAVAHYKQYLAMAPNAPDRAAIQSLIQQLEKK